MNKGFSLLEVLLATAILFGSAIVLFELAAIGREHVNSTEELAVAQRICETRINEILAGAEAVKSVESEELVEQPGWKLSVEVNPVDRHPGLATLRVTVFREPDEKRRGKQYTLVRWVRDPDQNGSALSPTDGMPPEPSLPGMPLPFGSELPEEGAEP